MTHSVTEGSFTLTATAQWVGADLQVTVTGGDAHIGSISMATPHPSLSDPTVTSATVSTLCYPGHRDDAIGNLFARTLCAKLNCNTVVLCGIHYDNLAPQDLAIVMYLGQTLLDTLPL